MQTVWVIFYVVLKCYMLHHAITIWHQLQSVPRMCWIYNTVQRVATCSLVMELFVTSIFPKKLNSENSMEWAHFLSLLMLAVLLILYINYFCTIRWQKVAASSYKIFTATHRYIQTFTCRWLSSIKVMFDKCDIFQSLGTH